MADFKRVWYREILPLLQEYFYEDRRHLIAVLGRYDSESLKGFVETREPANLLGDGGIQDEKLWDFHEYKTGEMETALRETFT